MSRTRIARKPHPSLRRMLLQGLCEAWVNPLIVWGWHLHPGLCLAPPNFYPCATESEWAGALTLMSYAWCLALPALIQRHATSFHTGPQLAGSRPNLFSLQYWSDYTFKLVYKKKIHLKVLASILNKKSNNQPFRTHPLKHLPGCFKTVTHYRSQFHCLTVGISS